MKLAIYLTIFFLMINGVYAQVVISQVYPNPISSESGGEFVELQNIGTTLIDISGWVLSTDTSPIDAIIPEGVVLQPNQTYLIADSGWEENKDNPSWPSANHEEAITLKNAGGKLILSNNETVDAIGWGETDVYEGTPADVPSEGKALLRIQETNNNADDFEIGIPSFETEAATDIQVSLSITSNPILIESVQITDEQQIEGFQIFPKPGDVKAAHITISIRGSSMGGKAIFLEKQYPLDIITINQTHTNLEGDIFLNYSLPPDIYPVDIQIEGAQIITMTENISFLPLLAFSLDTAAISFDNLSPGQLKWIYGDDDMKSQRPTVQNSGNVPLDMGIRGSEISGTGNLFSNILSISIGGIESMITEIETIFPLHMIPGRAHAMSIKAEVPFNITMGSYEGMIHLVGIAAE